MSTPQNKLTLAPPPSSEENSDEALDPRAAIDYVGRKYKIPKGLRRALFSQESNEQHYNKDGSVKVATYAPHARAGRGIGQLIPSTARGLGVNPDDPEENLVGSMHLLRSLYDKARKTAANDAEAWARATAGYFSGEGNMASTPGAIFIKDKSDGRVKVSEYVDSIITNWAAQADPDVDWEIEETSTPTEVTKDAEVKAGASLTSLTPPPPASPSTEPDLDESDVVRINSSSLADPAPQRADAQSEEGRKQRDSERLALSQGGSAFVIPFTMPEGRDFTPEDARAQMAAKLSKARGIPVEFVSDWLVKNKAGVFDPQTLQPIQGAAAEVLFPAEKVGELERDYHQSLSLPSQAVRRVGQFIENTSPGEMLVEPAEMAAGKVKEGLEFARPVLEPVGRVLSAADAMATARVMGMNDLEAFVAAASGPEAHPELYNPTEPVAIGLDKWNKTAGKGARLIGEMLVQPSNLIPAAVGKMAGAAITRAAKGEGRIATIAEELRNAGLYTADVPDELLEAGRSPLSISRGRESTSVNEIAPPPTPHGKMRLARNGLLGFGREIEPTTGRIFENGTPTEWKWNREGQKFEKKPIAGITKAEDTTATTRWYHGTRTGFEDFDVQKSSQANLYGEGIYFTDSPELAATYAGMDDGANIRPVAIQSNNPLDLAQAQTTNTLLAKLDKALSDIDALESQRSNPDAIPPPDLLPLADAFGQYRSRKGAINYEKYPGLDVIRILDSRENIKRFRGKIAEAASKGQPLELLNLNELPERDRLSVIAAALGYDSITHTGGLHAGKYASTGRHKVMIAFSPEQVLPAYGNVGINKGKLPPPSASVPETFDTINAQLDAREGQKFEKKPLPTTAEEVEVVGSGSAATDTALVGGGTLPNQPPPSDLEIAKITLYQTGYRSFEKRPDGSWILRGSEPTVKVKSDAELIARARRHVLQLEDGSEVLMFDDVWRGMERDLHHKASALTLGRIGPHENVNQWDLLKSGEKPAALEEAFDVEEYQRLTRVAKREGLFTSTVWDDGEGHVGLAVASTQESADRAAEVLAKAFDEGRDDVIGRTLGYSDADIDAYLRQQQSRSGAAAGAQVALDEGSLAPPAAAVESPNISTPALDLDPTSIEGHNFLRAREIAQSIGGDIVPHGDNTYSFVRHNALTGEAYNRQLGGIKETQEWLTKRQSELGAVKLTSKGKSGSDDFDPDLYLNTNYFGISDAERANLRSVVEAMADEGELPVPKSVESQSAIMSDSMAVDLDELEGVIKVDPGRREHRTFVAAARNRTASLAQDHARLTKELAGLAGTVKPELVDVRTGLEADLGRTEEDLRRYVKFLSANASDAGRALNFQKVMAQASLDPAYHVMRAKRLAERSGVNTKTDAWAKKERELYDKLGGGQLIEAEVKAKEAELTSAVAEEVERKAVDEANRLIQSTGQKIKITKVKRPLGLDPPPGDVQKTIEANTHNTAGVDKPHLRKTLAGLDQTKSNIRRELDWFEGERGRRRAAARNVDEQAAAERAFTKQQSALEKQLAQTEEARARIQAILDGERAPQSRTEVKESKAATRARTELEEAAKVEELAKKLEDSLFHDVGNRARPDAGGAKIVDSEEVARLKAQVKEARASTHIDRLVEPELAKLERELERLQSGNRPKGRRFSPYSAEIGAVRQQIQEARSVIRLQDALANVQRQIAEGKPDIKVKGTKRTLSEVEQDLTAKLAVSRQMLASMDERKIYEGLQRKRERLQMALRGIDPPTRLKNPLPKVTSSRIQVIEADLLSLKSQLREQRLRIAQTVKSFERTSNWTAFSAGIKSGLLMSVEGILKDKGSNAIFRWSDNRLAALPAAILDIVVTREGGLRSTAFLSRSEYHDAAKVGRTLGKAEAEEIRKFGMTQRTAESLDLPPEIHADFGRSLSESLPTRGELARLKLNDVYSRLVNYGFRMRSASDAVAHKKAFEVAKMERSKVVAINEARQGLIRPEEIGTRTRELFINPSDAMVAEALLDDKVLHEMADVATLRNDNKASTGIRALKRATGNFGGFFIDRFIPFEKAMTNYFIAGFQYTGLDLPPLAVEAFVRSWKGAIPLEQRKKLFRRFGRGTTGGGGAMLTGYLMAEAGYMTGPATKDRPLEDSMRVYNPITETWHSYDWLGPISIPLALGAMLSEHAHDGKRSEAAFGLVKQVPMVRGANIFANAFAGPEGASNFLGRTASTIIPTPFAQAAQLMDSTARKTSGEQSGFFDPTLNRIPFARELLPPDPERSFSPLDSIDLTKTRSTTPEGQPRRKARQAGRGVYNRRGKLIPPPPGSGAGSTR